MKINKLTILITSGLILSSCINNSIAPISTDLTYCSPDGKFTKTMPIQSHRSYCLKSNTPGQIYPVNSPVDYSFSIIDDQGNTLKDFAITHTLPMHLILVRQDLKYFVHLHPEFDQTTGQFTFPKLAFPADGTYRIFADFAVKGGQMDQMGAPLAITSYEEVLVGSQEKYTPEPIGSEEKTKTYSDYQVSLSSNQPLIAGNEVMLNFDLQQDGKPVTDLQEYLGALGHSIILRENTLDFIHAHPVEDPKSTQNGKVNFMVHFPEAGKYKIFTQFQKDGKVFTTGFVVSVLESEHTNLTNEQH